jgi:hypothetical protein
MTLQELATALQARLRQIEKDPTLNKPRVGLLEPTVVVSHLGVLVSYCLPVGQRSFLSKEQATAYLRWLEEGYVGRHGDVGKLTRKG